jgi:hypothetical protein
MRTDQGAYRDGSEALYAARDALRLARSREADGLPSAYARVTGRRMARIAAGWLGCGLAGLMVIAALLDGGAMILVMIPPGLAMVYLAARPLGAIRLARDLRGWLRASADPGADLDRLEADGAADVARKTARALESRSVFLPLAAVALIAPLLAHLAIWVLAKGWSARALQEFDIWIRLSLVLVGHSHLMLLYYVSRFTRALAQDSSELPSRLAARHGFAAWGRVTVWSPAIGLVAALVLTPFFPFGVLVPVVVMVLVAVTGAFIPIAFAAMASAVERERAQIG